MKFKVGDTVRTRLDLVKDETEFGLFYSEVMLAPEYSVGKIVMISSEALPIRVNFYDHSGKFIDFYYYDPAHLELLDREESTAIDDSELISFEEAVKIVSEGSNILYSDSERLGDVWIETNSISVDVRLQKLKFKRVKTLKTAKFTLGLPGNQQNFAVEIEITYDANTGKITEMGQLDVLFSLL